MDRTKNALEDIRIDVKIKLSALWASVMFCYIYADYFGLYVPGALQKMLNGRMGALGPTTQGVLLGTSVVMAIPSLMIFLSVALKPNLNRWLNIIFGVLYTVIILIGSESSRSHSQDSLSGMHGNGRGRDVIKRGTLC